MQSRQSPVAVVLPPHGVYVWETQHAHGFVMNPEEHAFAEVFYVLDGSGAFVLGGRAEPCGAGDVVVVPPGVVHVIEDRDSPLTLYGVGVSRDLLAHDLGPVLRAGVRPGSRSLAGRVRGGLRRLLHEQTDTQPGGRALMVGLTLQLLAVLARAPARVGVEHRAPLADTNRRAVERFRAELPHRFYEPLRLDRAAADLGMSRRSFTRLFRTVTGYSFAEYVERLRAEYACRLLRDTARGILSIAFECGYEDLSSFYRAFKRHIGVAPGAWRESGAVVPNLREVGPICQTE